MSAVHDYIQTVMDQVPPALPERERIARDLQAHLAETVEAEGSESVAVRRMGAADSVAMGYLQEVPMTYASFGSRVLAFLLDLALGLVVMLIVAAPIVGIMLALGQDPPGVTAGLAIATAVTVLVSIALLSIAYFPLLEWRLGQTLGKRVVGIHVVREDGRRISALQAIVRRIPFFLEFFWIDAIVALFTERHQRAFDLVARTVVTRVEPAAAIGAETRPRAAGSV